jgi:hypothetical protein
MTVAVLGVLFGGATLAAYADVGGTYSSILHVHFRAPASMYPEAIYLFGQRPGRGESWGTLCMAAQYVEGRRTLECDIPLRASEKFVFQIAMQDSAAPDGMRYWGDKSYSPLGGNGEVQGELVLSRGSKIVTWEFDPDLEFSDPEPKRDREPGERLVYRGIIDASRQ